MEYNFAEFEEGPREAAGSSVNVTVNNRGYFFLNGKALLEMGEPDAVVLMYDAKERVIGMQRAPIGRKSSYLLKRKAKNTAGRIVYAVNFCRHHDITPKCTLRFTAPEVKNGVLILDLKETERVTKV
jgi:hypothetical protein